MALGFGKEISSGPNLRIVLTEYLELPRYKSHERFLVDAITRLLLSYSDFTLSLL